MVKKILACMTPLLIGLSVMAGTQEAEAKKPPRPPASTTTTTTIPSTTTTTLVSPGPECTHVVSLQGLDTNPGTTTSPWRTINKGVLTIQAGDTLCVREGVYVENVKVSASAMRVGTPTAPIVVKEYPGETAVVRGLFQLSGPSYWDVSGFDVTWNSTNPSGEHMVKMLGGTGWRLHDMVLSEARSYAALLVGKHPTNGAPATAWKVDHNYIHHTYAANGLNQDHLIYVDNGQSGNGTIERNVLYYSPNGRGVKLGPGSTSLPGTCGIEIRYNTITDNFGPSNVQFSGSSCNNLVHHNIMDGSGAHNVTYYELSGANNVVSNNCGWDSSGVLANHPGIVDGGGNRYLPPTDSYCQDKGA